MNKRNIQTFLMVSAAFFAIGAPGRSGSANTLASAVTHTAPATPANANGLRPSVRQDDDAGTA